MYRCIIIFSIVSIRGVLRYLLLDFLIWGKMLFSTILSMVVGLETELLGILLEIGTLEGKRILWFFCRTIVLSMRWIISGNSIAVNIEEYLTLFSTRNIQYLRWLRKAKDRCWGKWEASTGSFWRVKWWQRWVIIYEEYYNH